MQPLPVRGVLCQDTHGLGRARAGKQLVSQKRGGGGARGGELRSSPVTETVGAAKWSAATLGARLLKALRAVDRSSGWWVGVAGDGFCCEVALGGVFEVGFDLAAGDGSGGGGWVGGSFGGILSDVSGCGGCCTSMMCKRSAGQRVRPPGCTPQTQCSAVTVARAR
jgi:hypothetical protein